MMCDEHGRGIIKDWHPNGHLRTFSPPMEMSGMWPRRRMVTRTHLQQQWQRTVVVLEKIAKIAGYKTETAWVTVPEVEATDDNHG